MKRKKGIICKVVKSGNRYNAFAADGTKHTHDITTGARKRALAAGMALERRVNKSGQRYWWKVPMSEYEATKKSSAPKITAKPEVEVPTGHAETMEFIQKSYSLKPRDLVIGELKWKYLIRSACLLYTSPSPRDGLLSRMPSSA